MEQRASIPPGLPRDNPTISYWQDPPSDISTQRTTSALPVSADIVILGSGITGAFVAHNLLSRPSPPKVLLLEARTACSGATGRNGGHTKHASYLSFLDNCRALGEEEAAKIARFEYKCMKAMHAFAREQRIECDSWEGDTVDIFYNENKWILAHEAVRQMKRLMGESDPATNYRFWGADDAQKQFLTQGAFGAVTYEAGSMSGYKLVIGMLKLATDRGLNLQTNTPAMGINKSERGWIVETPRGSVEAGRIVLATNGYTAHLYPPLQGSLVPLRGHVIAQRPGSNMPREGLATTYSFIYEDGYEYMISRPQGSRFAGDIIIGGGLTKAVEKGLYEYGTTDDTIVDPIIVSYLQNSTPNYFCTNWGEDDAGGRIRNHWSGIMGYSADGFPLIGEIPGENGLFVVASFQGHGMVLCLLSAKALVQIMDCASGTDTCQWLPKAFRVSEERLKHKFQGRLHTRAPKDLDLKSQI